MPVFVTQIEESDDLLTKQYMVNHQFFRKKQKIEG